MAPYNVYIVGESGSGKSNLTRGLLGSGSPIPANTNAETVAPFDGGFWDRQEVGETGDVSYQKDGKQHDLNIQESQGYRSRMGNTLLDYEAASNAHCVIFCLDGSQGNARSGYGFGRVLSYLASNKNDAKVIVAVTKTDKETTTAFTLPAIYEPYLRMDVNPNNHKQCLEFLIDTIANGEPLKVIKERLDKKAKDAEPAVVAAPAVVPKKNKTGSSIKSGEKKGLVNKLTELFSRGNKVEEKEQAEIPPVA